ncbi:Helicase C-terminal domain-containing protein [Aphelenchoides fujianensis]|nr:Helicase C-terminal domain-containing protein [Aphelenchoides fujianensis]
MISPAPTDGSSLPMDAPPPSPVESFAWPPRVSPPAVLEDVWDDDWQPPPRSQLAYANSSTPDSQFEYDIKTEPYERAQSASFSPTFYDEHFDSFAPKREPFDDEQHVDDLSDLSAFHSFQLNRKGGVEKAFDSRPSTPLSLLGDSSFKADGDEPTEEPLDSIYALDNELEVVGDGELPPVIDSWKETGFSTGVLVNAAYGEYHLNKNKEAIHRDGCDTNDLNQRIQQEILEVPFEDRKTFLFEFLKKLKDENGGEMPKTLMFVEAKRDADLLAGALCLMGISSHTVNSDRTQQQREEVTRFFRTGAIRTLVSTNVFARGLDIRDLDHVINVHLPADRTTYVNRIGRTGRLRNGKATTFFDPQHPADQEMAQTIIDELTRANQEVPAFLIKAVEAVAEQPPTSVGQPLATILEISEPEFD